MPAGLTGIKAISSGGTHSLALKSDGTVVAWGNNTNGQTMVPDGLACVVAISAGDYHSLALKSDGTVVAWGAGMTNPPANFADDGQSIVPAGLSNVVAISAGGIHSLALKSDGTVVAWGAGEPGDTSILFNVGQSTVPVGLNGVTAIAAGGWSSVALVGPPRLTPPERQPDGSTQLLLSGITGWTYTVDVSSDLVNWTPLGSFVSTNSVTPVLDAAASNFSHRFYRAVAP